MKLFEYHTKEINGEQEYHNTHLIAAENIDKAWEIARSHALEWYPDNDEPEQHKTDDPDVFEFLGGCIMLKIQGVGEISFEEWIRSQITYHSITEIPDELLKVEGVQL